MGACVSLRPIVMVVLVLVLLGSGCATMQPGQGVDTPHEMARATHGIRTAAVENETLAENGTWVVNPAPVVDPVEVVLQVQEIYFQHEGIGTRRDAKGHLHLEVNDDSLCFVFGQAQLKPKSAIPLRHLATVLIGYPESCLTISGHTDNIGNEEVNLRLSQERANALRGALLLYGVPPRTIVAAIGYGASRPRADNGTEEGRAMNRRVDLRIAIDAAEAAANQKHRVAVNAAHEGEHRGSN